MLEFQLFQFLESANFIYSDRPGPREDKMIDMTWTELCKSSLILSAAAILITTTTHFHSLFTLSVETNNNLQKYSDF